MSQPPPAWRALRAKHQDEIDALQREIEANRRDLDRRVTAAHAGLLARHSQQEKDFWRQASNNSNRALPTHQLAAANVQPITAKLSATSAHQHQKLSSTSGSPENQKTSTQPAGASFEAFDSQRRRTQTTLSASAAQRQTEHSLKPSLECCPAQRRNREKAVRTGGRQPPKSSQSQTSITCTQPQPTHRQECLFIDLCSDDSDDDVLVEVTKTAYRENKVEREDVKVRRSKQGDPSPAQLVPNTIHKPLNNPPSLQTSHNIHQQDSTALDAFSSIVSQRATTAMSPRRQARAAPQSTQASVSRASNRTRKATPSSKPPLRDQRGTFLASQTSNVSTKKRKIIELSDAEQSIYTPSRLSPFTASKKPVVSLGLLQNNTKAAPKAARTRNINKLIGHDSDDDDDEEEEEDDLDISDFTYVNGIIIQAGQEGRLKEAQTEATPHGNG
ncbi:hypothetical protein EJ07DRAFT_175773 [Lizonia empirigonia]|nr:hypothetical protein EJ07DRAFT_175773 [Lizonia empirigonia]